jgi:CheY-like chemotaxis protein
MSKVVLLIDDNPIDLMINEKTIARYNPELEIHKASSGKQALEMLESGLLKPNCVLLDIKMPEMNGFEFLAALKQANFDMSFGIHMLSSSIDPSDLKEAKNNPLVISYIEKPISAKKLNLIKLAQ